MIERAKNAAIEKHLDSGLPIKLRVNGDMQKVIDQLYAAGQQHAASEIYRITGQEPTRRALAGKTPDEVAVQLQGLLNGYSAKLNGKVNVIAAQKGVGVDLVAQSAIGDAAFKLPGALDVASRIVSTGLFAGMGDVYDANAGLFGQWQYSAVMDSGTCDPCSEKDGVTYESWDEAQDDLPDGGPNPDCDGEGRCRCRLVPVGESVSSDALASPPPFDGGQVEEIERLDPYDVAALNTTGEGSLEADALYTREYQRLEREVLDVQWPSAAAQGEAIDAVTRLGMDDVRVLRDDNGKMLGVVDFNAPHSASEIADVLTDPGLTDAERAELQRLHDFATDKSRDIGVNHLASTGEVAGTGARLMREVAKVAAQQGRGVGLNSLDEARGFYVRLGMHAEPGSNDFYWTKEEAAHFAKTGKPLASSPLPEAPRVQPYDGEQMTYVRERWRLDDGTAVDTYQFERPDQITDGPASDWLDKLQDEWGATIDPRDFEAVKDWQREVGFKEINDYTRHAVEKERLNPSPTGVGAMPIRETVERLDRLIADAPAIDRNIATNVYRGVTDLLTSLGIEGDRVRIGQRFIDKGFQSTTTEIDIAYDYAGAGGIVEIELPEGANGLWLRSVGAEKRGAYVNGENRELLLPRDTEYEVTGVGNHYSVPIIRVRPIVKEAPQPSASSAASWETPVEDYKHLPAADRVPIQSLDVPAARAQLRKLKGQARSLAKQIAQGRKPRDPGKLPAMQQRVKALEEYVRNDGTFTPPPQISIPNEVVTKNWRSQVDVLDAGTPIVQKHLADIALMPEHVLAQLAEKGVRWFIGNRPMTELDENGYLRGVRPRGWPAGSTWDRVAGGYSPGRSFVTAGEGRSGSASLILHETGHAIGDDLGIDNSPELIAHHKRLYSKLSPYLRQGGRGGEAGREELLAESVAERLIYGRERTVAIYDEAYVSWLDALLGLPPT